MFGEDFNPKDFETREAADKSVFVKFYTKPVQNSAKSADAGRPIFDEREYIEIRTPGDQNNVINRPVADMDRQRFRGSYRQFKEGIQDQLVGTPLTEVPFLTRAQCEELSYLRIRTVEALAELRDDVCGSHAGLYKLKQTAQSYMERASQEAPFASFQKRLEEMQEQLTTAQATINDQSRIIQNLKSASKES